MESSVSRTQRGLVAEVSEACRERLVGAGFRARPGDIFTRPVAGQSLGWLGLNKAVGRHDGSIEINPVVGIRHQAVESMVAELLGEKSHAYIPATLSKSLGYLMPAGRYKPWIFGRDRPMGTAADEFTAAVIEYGLPFMEQYGSLAEIVDAMSGRAGIGELVAFRLPVGYLLLGESHRAQDAIETSMKAVGDRSDLAAQRYRVFASAFQRKLDVRQAG